MAESPNERGAAVVEMAFVAILLIFLATGIADIGRAVFTYIGIQDAAQEGAAFASFSHEDRDAIRDRARTSIDYPTLTPSSIEPVCSADGKTMTVTVTHAVDIVTPILGELVGDEIELKRSFTADVLGGTCNPNP